MNACAKPCVTGNKIDDMAHMFNGYVQMEEECQNIKCEYHTFNEVRRFVLTMLYGTNQTVGLKGFKPSDQRGC